MAKREILRSFTTLKKDEIKELAIGGFDGVHLAHQELIKRISNDNGAVLSIYRDTLALTPKEKRFRYIKNGGFLLNLDDIKELSYKEFIEFLDKNFKNLKKIVVGYDFRYGKDRKGDIDTLKRDFRGEVVVVDEIKRAEISVHARVIKELLSRGDIQSANRLLGRKYSISSLVVSGQGIGKKELFATLNFTQNGFFLPKDGVYVTNTKIDNTLYRSVTFIGVRSSTDNQFSIESHIIGKNFDEVLDKKELEVYFLDFIRENKKFSDLKRLKDQISKDIQYSAKF